MAEDNFMDDLEDMLNEPNTQIQAERKTADLPAKKPK